MSHPSASATTSPATESSRDPSNAFQVVPFRWFFVGNILFIFGIQLQTAVAAWEIYERTGELLDLAKIGLVQVVPAILLAIPAGQLIDRVDRRKVIIASLILFLISALTLAAISWFSGPVEGILACLFFNGVVRVVQQPAKASLLPRLVPRAVFANAVTWSTTGFQFALVTGPAAAGLLLRYLGPLSGYLVAAVLAIVFIGALLQLPNQPPQAASERISWGSLLAGVAYLRRTRLLLAVISLDMFAVLFGGCTALLPVFAKDILDSGPSGYGWLRAAPGIGALLMSFALASRPPMRRTGPALFGSVAVFALATIGFGLSRSLPLSWFLLLVTGAFDMISVIIRHTLMQLWTPDAMRGRVSAINGMFISVSNELGSAESGYVAHLFERPGDPAFGPTISTVSGGIGSLIVIAMIAWLYPEVRRHGRLDQGPDELTHPPAEADANQASQQPPGQPS